MKNKWDFTLSQVEFNGIIVNNFVEDVLFALSDEIISDKRIPRVSLYIKDNSCVINLGELENCFRISVKMAIYDHKCIKIQFKFNNGLGFHAEEGIFLDFPVNRWKLKEKTEELVQLFNKAYKKRYNK